MTVIASSPAPTSAPAPVAPGPAHAGRQGGGEPSAFTDLLDSLPGGDAKASSSIAHERERTTDDPKRGEARQAQGDGRAARFDGVAMALSPFVALSVALPGEVPHRATKAPAPAAASAPAPKAEGESAPQAASAAKANAAVGARLVGERAFLSSLSAAGAIAGPLPAASQGPPAATLSPKSPGQEDKGAPMASRAPIAPHPPVAPAARETAAAGGNQGPPRRPPPPTSPSRPRPTPQSRATGRSGRSPASGPPDPGASDGRASTPGDVLGAQTSAPLPGSAPPGLQDSPARAAEAAPRANALSAGPALQASRVKEIDLDLSPGGHEDVTMTMRLAGDRLSVVIRAASSQTTGAIEGARDAIVDRLAAIGQPLELVHHPADRRESRWRCEREWRLERRGRRRRRPAIGRARRFDRSARRSRRRFWRLWLLAPPGRGPKDRSPASGK